MKVVTNIIGFLSIAMGIITFTMVASDIQVILGAVFILGGLNLMKSCECKGAEDKDTKDDK